jgi:hypothetical protein
VLGLEVILFRYHLISLPDIALRDLPEEHPLVFGLSPLLAGRPSDPVDVLRSAATGIAKADLDSARKALLADFVDHYVPLSDADSTRLMLEMGHNQGEEGRGMPGFVEFVEKQSARKYIANVVAARFGALPGEAASTLEQLKDRDHLDRLLLEAATVESLNQFLARLQSAAADENRS